MKELRRLLIAVPAAVLVVFLVASYLTRGAMAHLPFLNGQADSSTSGNLVDQRPWQTVESLAPLADSAEEQSLAHEAERLADHDTDQAFALALRQAAMDTPVLTGDALALQQRLTALKQVVKDDQAHLDSLTASTKPNAAPESSSDDLDVARAQLQLDTDELTDVTAELARVSGDKRSRIEQELAAREASMKKFDARASSGGQIAVISAKRHGTLYGRAKSWFDQQSRMTLLRQAKAQTDADIAALAAQNAAIVRQATAATAGIQNAASQPATAASTTATSRVARIQQAHTLAQVRGILDDRLQTTQQLSVVYQKWLQQVQLQHRIVTHLALQSLSWIAFLILAAVLISTATRLFLDRSTMDRRRLHTLGTIANLGIQLVTFLLVLLILFGAPSQTPTILGLGAAGLTVVFQDFILAFFGWFILMGKNGIRVGDWVEINGVGGEVVEIGLFRTALLETGNWTDKGHPTGRRVTFINNFAISGQYFNFSTTGQWMWDEITVNIPPGVDSYKTIEAIHNTVLKETQQDAELAEQEWQNTTRHNGLSQFKATPSVDMRPAASGVDILVRYVIRAGNRFEMRNRLYQSVIELLHQPAEPNQPPQPEPASHPVR